MCFNGNSGSGGGNDWSYFANIQRDRDNQAARDAETAANLAKAEKDRLHQEFLTKTNELYAPTVQKGRDYFSRLGYGADDSLINRIVSEAIGRIPNDDSRPEQYLTDDIFDAGVAADQGRVRTANQSKVNQAFAPGFQNAWIGDTLDDSILDTILGEQTGSAMKQLDYNKARGVINDLGYNNALDKFKGQSAAAKSTLTGIGDSVLGTTRQGLKDIAGEAGSAGSGWTFGSPNFDLTPYLSRANDYVTNAKTGLEGKVRAAVGNTQLFDIPTILQSAGTAQGPINLTTQGNDVAGASFDATRKKNRGLQAGGGF